MAHHHHDAHPPVPRPALWAVAGLLALSAGAAMLGRYADVGHLTPPAIETPAQPTPLWVPTPVGEAAPPDRVRTLSFLRSENGRVEVREVAADGARRLAGVLEPGQSSFVANLLRALDYERGVAGVARDEPYRVMAWRSGRLAIEDLATGRRIELNGFGASNSAAIATLFTLGDPTP